MLVKLAFVYLLIFLSFILCLVNLSDLVGYNSVDLSVNPKRKLFSFLPQGWAFFTRSPRETQVYLLKKKNNEFIVENFYHSNVNNLFGIKRNVTRINYELISIYGSFKKTDFTDGYSNIQKNIVDKIPAKIHYVKNIFDDPFILGEYVIVLQKLVPYAWFPNINKEKMACKSIRFYVY